MVRRLLAYIQAINEARKGRRKLLAPPASTPGTDSTNTHEQSATDSQETVAGAVKGISSMAKIAVTTRSYNSQRSIWNYNESVQTPAKIRAHGMRLARQFKMWGDNRGSEGFPLLAPNVTMRDGLKHDVMILNTMGGDVFAFDHDTLRPLWVQHILNAVPSTRNMDMWGIADNWSFLATPVLDLARGISWHCGMHSPDGSYDKSTWKVMGLNIVDGSLASPIIDLAPATYNPPNGLPQQVWGSVQRKQRCALLLDYNRNGVSTLFLGAGSFAEGAPTNRGLVVAVDVTNPAKAGIATMWTSSSAYSGCGIWMSGGGPAMDDDGNIFFVCGNGAFDAKTEFGESLVKLKYTPATATAKASISVVGNATRFTDTGNVGGSKYQTLADLSLIPPSVYSVDDNPGGTSNMDSKDDMDECSHVTIMRASETGFSTDIAFYSGKGGIGVLADAKNMPNQKLSDFAPDLIQANVYGRMLAITGFTDAFGYGAPNAMDITPTDLSLLQSTFGGLTRHLHSGAAHYQSPTAGCLIYGGGENGAVRCFQITEPSPGKFAMTYMATGTAIASPGVPEPGGMPGWHVVGWSDGNKPNTGAIACFAPYGNANRDICPGRLIIYSADNFINGQLEVLWDGEQWNNGFPNGDALVFNKFLHGAMINGALDYFTYDARVLQFT